MIVLSALPINSKTHDARLSGTGGIPRTNITSNISAPIPDLRFLLPTLRALPFAQDLKTSIELRVDPEGTLFPDHFGSWHLEVLKKPSAIL